MRGTKKKKDRGTVRIGAEQRKIGGAVKTGTLRSLMNRLEMNDNVTVTAARPPALTVPLGTCA